MRNRNNTQDQSLNLEGSGEPGTICKTKDCKGLLIVSAISARTACMSRPRYDQGFA